MKSRRLWDVVDGEPFLVNPRLGILSNSRRRSKTRPKPTSNGAKKMARRARDSKGRFLKAGSRRRTATTRRRRTNASAARPGRRRRNAYPIGGVVVANPRRRRTTRRRSTSVARRRRTSYRRNPRLMGVTLPPMTTVIFAGAGFIAPPMIEGFLSRFVPYSLQGSAIGRYGLRIVSVLGLTYGVRRFVGVKESNAVLTGGSVYVLKTALDEFAPGMFGGYGPVPLPAGEGVSRYVRPGTGPRAVRTLASYVPSTGPAMTAMGGKQRKVRRG